MSATTLTVTPEEAGEAVEALHERLFEAERYAKSTLSMIQDHEGHGQACCSAHRLPSLHLEHAAFEQRVATLKSLIEKMEAVK